MEQLFTITLPLSSLVALALGLFIAGTCKGILGLGLPLIAVPVLVSFLPIRDVLAIMWLPMMWANALQTFQGGGAASAFRRFWPVMLMMGLGAWGGTVALVRLDNNLLLAVVGTIVMVFSTLSLIHPRLTLPARLERPVGIGIGMSAGVLLGISLHMGPLLAIYYVALNLGKDTFIRSIGTSFLAGVVIIGVLYISYGVFEWRHIPLTIGATIPVALGGWLGQRLRAHINPVRFRKALFILLILIGANLIRRTIV